MEIILLRHPVVWLSQIIGIVVGSVAILTLAAYLIRKKARSRRG